MDNDLNKNTDDTPNYYGGGIPNPTTQPPVNNPYGQQPYSNPVQPQYGGQQNPYAPQQPPYQPQMPAYGVVPPTQTNKNAVISLIVSLVSLFILCGVPIIGTVSSIVGIVFGHKALKETKDVPNSGNGVALAGTICGYVAVLASIVVTGIIALVFLAALMGEASGY